VAITLGKPKAVQGFRKFLAKCTRYLELDAIPLFPRL